MCNVVKPLDEFQKRKGAKDGHRNECADCSSLCHKTYYLKNREERLSEAKQYYLNNKKPPKPKIVMTTQQRIESRRLSDKKNRDTHKEKRKALGLAWRLAHPERTKELHRKYAIENKDHVNAKNRNRSAMKRGNGGTHTKADIDLLYSRQAGKCVCCNTNLRKTYHVDHIHPLSKGGHNGIENIQLLCPTCNVKKYNKEPHVFMREQGYLL